MDELSSRALNSAQLARRRRVQATNDWAGAWIGQATVFGILARGRTIAMVANMPVHSLESTDFARIRGTKTIELEHDGIHERRKCRQFSLADTHSRF